MNFFLNKKLVEELNQANQKLKEYVHTDVGTGINNRLALNETLEHEWHSAMMSQEMISLIMIDIDFSNNITIYTVIVREMFVLEKLLNVSVEIC